MNPTVFYSKGYKYILRRPYVIQTEIRPDHFIIGGDGMIRLDTDGTLYLKERYAWNGANGPTVDTLDSMAGSLVHDAFCQLINEGLLSYALWRQPVDRELWRLITNDGMNVVRADAWYEAVRLYANVAGQQPDVEILSAPVAGVPVPED